MRYIIRFTGHVQGVCFRATCVAQSRGLDVHGFVRNESDGSVLLDVDGRVDDLKELIGRIESEMAGNIDSVTIDKSHSNNRTGGLRIAY